ncbi:MAG: TraB/GumN family protein [Pseudomonadota bacterium]|nr:TraB/GumN family protein [Pseudomonadota bacterium]
MRSMFWCLLALTPALSPGVVHATAALTALSASTIETLPAPAPAPNLVRDPGAEERIVDIDVVLVSGLQSGPALWKVSKGEHALWILGTVSPVPKRMDWYSPEAESVIAKSQEIIGRPGFVGDVGVSGMFKMAFAMPTMLRARNNPDGKELQDVLPPDLYARWLALKPIYLGKDRDIEKRRPVFAAAELYEAAIKRAGLTPSTGVGKRVNELVKQHGVKQTSTHVRRKIEDPKRLARSFAQAEVNDVQCFRNILDRLEADVASAAQRANAWAIGDIAEITRLFNYASLVPCWEALAQTEAARSMGMGEGMARSQAQWLEAAEAALAANSTSFATLPMADLLDADGLLARLKERGYEVVVPE